MSACRCGCATAMHIGEIGCPCALPGEPPCETPQATANLLLEVAVQWAAELIKQGRTATARRRLADGLEAARFVLGEGSL